MALAPEDLLSGLPELARVGEDAARPLPAERVRRLGRRRRIRRRIGTLAVAVVAAVVVGGTVVSTSRPGTDLPPSPAGTPSPNPTPTTATGSPGRTVTTANLIAPTDLPRPEGGGRIEEYDPVEPGHRQIPSCGDGELDRVGAAAWVRRNLTEVYAYGPGETPDPDAPGAGLPTMCVVAWQLASPAAAEEAGRAYQERITKRRNSPTYLEYGVRDTLGFDWTEQEVSGGTATVAEIVYAPTGSDDAFWESHGLTRVGDRLMLTVYRHVGTDWNVALDRDAGQGGMDVHPQLGLVEAAATRLGR